MKIVIICIGKTDAPYLNTGIDLYLNRLKHYGKVEFDVINEQKIWKKLAPPERKSAEGAAILAKLLPGDTGLLCDEAGSHFSSTQFAGRLEKAQLSGTKRMVFIIGGAFGFSPEVYAAVPERISLSAMTFNHEMVRLFLVEQIYRGFTILRSEPYHNG